MMYLPSRNGLQLHLDAYRVHNPATGHHYVPGERVDAWADLSGHEWHLNGYSNDRPLAGTDAAGRPCVQFAGGHAMLNETTYASTPAVPLQTDVFTILAVVKLNGAYQASAISFSQPGKSSTFNFAELAYFGAVNQSLYCFRGNGSAYTESGAYGTQALYSPCVLLGQSVATQVWTGVNGVRNPGRVVTMAAADVRSVYLGARYLNGNPWQGNIYEVLVYNRALSDAERLRLTRVLCAKWGAPYQGA